MSDRSDLRWSNLAEIVGLDANNATRVVSFLPEPDGGLTIVEECDAYFSVRLTPGQAARLVDWLSANTSHTAGITDIPEEQP